MLALAGGIETGRANVAARNSSFSGTSSAEYKGLDGRTVGTSQGTFQGSISNPAAGRAAMNDISDRTDANIARVRSASEGAKATAADLILDRETVFPNGTVTFMLVPKIEKASLKVLAQYLLVANIGGDVHKIVFQKNVGD